MVENKEGGMKIFIEWQQVKKQLQTIELLTIEEKQEENKFNRV